MLNLPTRRSFTSNVKPNLDGVEGEWGPFVDPDVCGETGSSVTGEIF